VCLCPRWLNRSQEMETKEARGPGERWRKLPNHLSSLLVLVPVLLRLQFHIFFEFVDIPFRLRRMYSKGGYRLNTDHSIRLVNG